MAEHIGLLKFYDTALLILLDKLGQGCNLKALSISEEIPSRFDGLPRYIYVDTVNQRENCFTDSSHFF